MINRDNCEEFFLLYVDKELDDEGCAAVENFVKQNPDLAKELKMLQQTTLFDDSNHFIQKEILYKEEKSISLSDYEEYFLLFADNELGQQQIAEVENFVLKHPQLQDEFTLLQQTRLQPERIAFAGKEKLYRKEKKERRIVPITLIRMGAAAAIAGIVYISFIVTNNESSNKPVITASQDRKKTTLPKDNYQSSQKSVTEKTGVSLSPGKESSKSVKNTVGNSSIKQKKNTLIKFEKTKKSEEAFAVNKATEKRRKILIEKQSLATAESLTPKPEPIEPNGDIKNSTGNITTDAVDNGENNVLINEPVAKESPALVTHAVYLETDNIEEEKSVYIGSAGINKNKLKGLLKKAAVFLDKRIRRNDD